jgi:PAS domain S-box-containing protein
MKKRSGKEGEAHRPSPALTCTAGSRDTPHPAGNSVKSTGRQVSLGETIFESEVWYRTVADFTYDWEFWIDPWGRILYTSPSAETILQRPVGGYSSFEQLLRDVVHPEDLPARLAHLSEEMKGKKPSELEFRIVRPDGDVRWIHHVCQPVISPEGKFLGTRGSNRDVTERHAAENALAVSNKRLADVFASIQDDFYVLDRDWNFVFASMKFSSRIGRKPDDLLGKCIWEMFPKYRGTVYEENLRSAREKQEVRRFEFPGQYTDGWYSMTVFPSPEGITVHGTDITERRNAEEALCRSELQVRSDLEAMKILQEIGSLYLHEGNLEPVLTQIVDAAISFTGSDFGNIQLVDPHTSDLRIVAQRNFPDWWIEFWNTSGKGQGACGSALQRGERVIIEDIEQDPSLAGTPALAILRRAGIRAITSTPLVSRKGVLLGMFSTHFSRPCKPDDPQLRLLDLLARQAADIIERAQSETKLRDSEEKYRSIVETTNEGIWIVDAKRQTTYVNRQMAEMLGYTPEEMLGKSYRGCVDDEFAAISDRVTEERKRGIRGSIEFRLRKKDGSPLWVFINSQPQFDREGNFTGSLSMVTDITDRKMTEDALRQSEAEHSVATAIASERRRLYDVLEALPVYVCLLDADYRMPFANRYFRESFKEPAGRRCYEFLFDRDTPCETCESYTVMKTRAPHHWFWTGPNGRDYDIHDFPFIDADGTFMILEMGIDITERRMAEEEVRLANAYNRSLIEASLDPLITISPRGTISDVNEAMARVTGFSRNELVGTDFSGYFTEPAKAKAGYEKVFRLGSVTDYALEIRHRDGHVTPVLYNANVYRDASGEISGVFAGARDITDLRKVEESLRKEHELLEERVKLRTAELAIINAHLQDEIANRRRAEEMVRKTISDLHTAIESTADGICAVDGVGRIIRYNQKFATMWKIPDDILQSSDDRNVTTFLKTQVKNPALFPTGDEASLNKSREIHDTLELNDGRIFERYSTPQMMDSTIVGRVSSYRDITDRKHAEERLLQSLQEKETLIREIHHRVKNNLQIISGLLDMTRMRTPDPTTHGILTDMMMKIKTMAQIHTRLYESKQFDRINMGSQIRDQVTDLSSIYGRAGAEIEAEIETQNIYLPVDQAIPCALIVNEILSNAFKHAFHGRRRGTLCVSAEQDGERVRIVVVDNGIGIPGGIDAYKTTSLGLKLIRSLAMQLGGAVEIASENGTSVTVEFPITVGR